MKQNDLAESDLAGGAGVDTLNRLRSSPERWCLSLDLHEEGTSPLMGLEEQHRKRTRYGNRAVCRTKREDHLEHSE